MTTEVTRGYPANYKDTRRRTWTKMAPHWADYTRRDSFHSSIEGHLLSAVLKSLAPLGHSGASLVDLGCGCGVFLKGAQAALNHTTGAALHWNRLVGLDFCPAQLKAAHDNDVSGWPRLKFLKVDLEEPLQGQTPKALCDFDVATAIFLLDEIEGIGTCFASAASMLRNGGHFICATLDYEREMQRFGTAIEAVKGEGKPVVLRKPLRTLGAWGELFRVLRETAELDEHARRNGLRLTENSVMLPEQLGSRLDGPALRLLSWRKQ